MHDAVGYRSKWGVIVPSTGTVVEHDFNLLTPHGVTVHAGRTYIGEPSMSTNEQAMTVLDQMEQSFDIALRDVMTLLPDQVVIAMSAELMRRGVKGCADYVDEVAQRAGVPVIHAPAACEAALRTLGIERIAMITPYQPKSDQLTTDYFTALGFEVVAIKGLRCASATAIAEVRPPEIIAALREVDSPRAQALVQVGTNLSMVRLAGEAEHWFGKPTISMNAATVWHALREAGITDQFPHFGTLFENY